MRTTVTIFILVLASITGICHADDDPVYTCRDNVAADPEFKGLSSKMPLGGVRDVTFQMLANESYPNLKERKAIADLVIAHMSCTKAGDAYRQRNYPPQVVAMLNESESNMVSIAAELYNKKLTYGQFNKRLKAIDDDLRSKMISMLQERRSQQEADQRIQRQSEQERQDVKRNSEEASRSAEREAERARQETRQRNEQALAQREAAHQQLTAQCKLIYNQTLLQQQQRSNECYAGYGNSLMSTSCVMLKVEVAKAYAQNQYDICMSADAQ